ncbi:L,D-transpeptidase family protein [Thalassobaculum sp. OXR-137]|uniref:L,D-transpeptidase family protein n=1 Tax=Thalassobaculum sp. OXR-137 TaxID=3100173 RepID=UPI002AC91A46|nr:L,D-transpeptidase family protein [Thalassobaculum sp. OXR-137]WPZ33960.1 L,D-transpeptidase family protein [Thalassobaculum sp. OXR-137]
MLYSRSLLAGLVAGSSLLMTVSSAAGQHAMPVSLAVPSETDVAALPLAEMLGDPAGGDLTGDIERLVMQGFLETGLSADIGDSAVQAGRMAYAQDLFQPIWSKAGAESLIRLNENLLAYGLPVDPDGGEAVAQVVERRFDAPSDADRARADIELTAIWLRIAAAVSGGLEDEGAAVASLANQPARSLLTTALRRAGEGDAIGTLTPFEPESAQYKGLKKALHQYIDIQSRGGWYAIPDGDLVREGDHDSRIPQLRARLQAEGYAIAWETEADRDDPAPTPTDSGRPLVEVALKDGAAEDGAIAERAADLMADPTELDAPLVATLKDFQSRHGLEPDGVVGPMTLAALNESVESKVGRIVRAMEQWRSQGALGERYVWANIPSFTAEGWNAGRREIRMKTVVGMPSRETPIFSDQIEYTVANPKWYVPVSIARRDKLPKLIEDATYADRKGFTVYERSTGLQVSSSAVNWRDPGAVNRYRLVQNPGSSNALGELKIIFPNRHSVYLHGTPSTSLFKRASRAFSSGCVRLERPVAMANWLASHDTRASEAQIRRAVASGENRHIRFGAPIPVHLTYVTVTVDDEGVPNFWRDIYKRDDQIHFVERYAPPEIQTTASVALDSMGPKPAD